MLWLSGQDGQRVNMGSRRLCVRGGQQRAAIGAGAGCVGVAACRRLVGLNAAAGRGVWGALYPAAAAPACSCRHRHVSSTPRWAAPGSCPGALLCGRRFPCPARLRKLQPARVQGAAARKRWQGRRDKSLRFSALFTLPVCFGCCSPPIFLHRSPPLPTVATKP